MRLRGRNTVGATLVDVLATYANKLKAAGGRLYLTGISEGAYSQIVRTGKLHLSGPVRVYEAMPIVGQSTREAYADAETWLVNLDVESSQDEGSADRLDRLSGEEGGENREESTHLSPGSSEGDSQSKSREV